MSLIYKYVECLVFHDMHSSAQLSQTGSHLSLACFTLLPLHPHHFSQHNILAVFLRCNKAVPLAPSQILHCILASWALNERLMSFILYQWSKWSLLSICGPSTSTFILSELSRPKLISIHLSCWLSFGFIETYNCVSST